LKNRYESRELAMLLKLFRICSVVLFSCVALQVVAAAPNRSCNFPAGLGTEIAKKYPSTRPVSLADLDDYDKELFKKDHGTQCPGLIAVDFYGDHNPTWAIVLISGENPKREAQLIVARKLGTNWDIGSITSTSGTPVVWSEPPGKYEGVWGDKAIHARNPVIVFCGYESWVVVYAWNGKEVEKVQMSD
jgi:hypothetical protein